jgi:SAM-dependent methyltransferase
MWSPEREREVSGGIGPAEHLLAEVREFLKSRVILTAAALDIFTGLHGKPATARQLAGRLRLQPRGTTRVLDCLVTLGLLEKRREGYSLTSSGELLSSRHPNTILPMVLHLNSLWESWGGLTETVKRGKNPRRAVIRERETKSLKAFIGAMHVVGRSLAGEIATSYDAGRFSRLLDIGGGSGTYTIAFLKKNPKLTAVLLDLKRVIPMARERLRGEGLLERVKLAAGNFYKDELPAGCDLAILSAIIHQNSPAENLALFRKVRRALEPGGALLIRDHIMNESRTDPPAGALFALNMLVNTDGGDTYTFAEVRKGLERAGFVDVRLVRTGERMDCLVEARKP